jgi:hypothetical protein
MTYYYSIPHGWVGKVPLPRTAAPDERLHQRALGLDGVIKVVRRPIVRHLIQRHRAWCHPFRG